MPIYDFACRDCGKLFEALVLKEQPECPGCNSKNLEQQITTFMVSSENTRESNMRGVKAKNAKLRRDYQMDMAEMERNHHH
jgi:putative FmdB family regulatory protein